MLKQANFFFLLQDCRLEIIYFFRIFPQYHLKVKSSLFFFFFNENPNCWSFDE